MILDSRPRQAANHQEQHLALVEHGVTFSAAQRCRLEAHRESHHQDHGSGHAMRNMFYYSKSVRVNLEHSHPQDSAENRMAATSLLNHWKACGFLSQAEINQQVEKATPVAPPRSHPETRQGFENYLSYNLL